MREIERAGNIEVRASTEVVGAAGTGRLQQLTLRCSRDNTDQFVDAAGLFILIGAVPRTVWLPQALAREPGGFILTGQDVLDAEETVAHRYLELRGRLADELSMPLAERLATQVLSILRSTAGPSDLG